MRHTWVFLAAAMLFAGACDKDENTVKKLGEKVGSAAVDFGSGVGKAVDEKMLVKVEVGPGLTGAGAAVTSSKGLGVEGKGVAIYLTTKNALKASLIAKAMNKDGQEIGRSLTEVDFTADDGKYVNFIFDKQFDTQLVDKYLIDVKK